MKISIGDAVVEGTRAEIAELLETPGVARLMGEEATEDYLASLGLYRSTSKGIIPISSMNSMHIRRTLAKIYSEWVDAFRANHYNTLTNREFVAAMTSGISNNKLAQALFTQLVQNGED